MTDTPTAEDRNLHKITWGAHQTEEGHHSKAEGLLGKGGYRDLRSQAQVLSPAGLGQTLLASFLVPNTPTH